MADYSTPAIAVEIFRETIKKATAKFAEDNGFLEPEGFALTEEEVAEQAIINATIKGDWGCQRSNVFDLISALTGIERAKFKSAYRTGGGHGAKIKYVEYAAVVALDDDNSHNYGIGNPVVVMNDDCGSCVPEDASEVSMGNHLHPSGAKKHLRPCTDEEIAAFPEDSLKAIMEKWDVTTLFEGVAELFLTKQHLANPHLAKEAE